MKKNYRVKTGYICPNNPELYEMSFYDGKQLVASIEVFRGNAYVDNYAFVPLKGNEN